MWNWNEIARSFDFRNIAKTPTVSRLLIDYKGLIKKLKSRQKTIKYPARSQRSWYMSMSSCLLKIYGITAKSYIKDKSNETRLDGTIDNNEVNITGYDLIRKDRNRNGGGVAIYIRNVIPYTICNH